MRLEPSPRTTPGGAANGGIPTPCPSCDGSSHVTACCLTCCEVACDACMSTKHEFHETKQVAIVAEDIRQRVQENIGPQKKQDKYEAIKEVEELIFKNKSELRNVEARAIDDIIKHIDVLHDELKRIRQSLITGVTTVVERSIKHLNDAETNADKVVTSIRTLCDTADRIISETDDIKVIEKGYTLPDELLEAFNVDIQTPVRSPVFNLHFVPGIIDAKILNNMCGKVRGCCLLKGDNCIRMVISSKSSIMSKIRLYPTRYVVEVKEIQ